MRNCALLLVVFLLSSCCKATLNSITVFKNNTNEKIELRFYRAGEFKSSIIDANSTTNAFFDIPSRFADSAYVIINNEHRQTHYDLGIIKSSDKIDVVLFDEPRNLLKISNYEIVNDGKSSSCGTSTTTYTYTF